MSNYIYDLEIALAHRRFGWTPSYVSRAGPCEYSIIDSNLEFFVLLELDLDQTLLGPSSEYYKLQDFTIISTIIQKQPAMEKTFQDNYSKSLYSKVVVYGKDEQWFACWKEEACWLWDVFEEEKLHKFTIVSSPCSSATPSWSGRWSRPDPCLSTDKVWMSTKYEEEVYLL